MYHSLFYLYRRLETIPVILLLNKQDLLATKIKTNGARLSDYFPDFVDYTLSEVDSRKKPTMTNLSSILLDFASDNISSGEDPEVNRAKYFLRDQFLVSLFC